MQTLRNFGRPILGAVLLGLAVPQPVDAADPSAELLKKRVLDHARTVTVDDYSFTRTARTEQIEGDKKTERVVVERFDPSHPQRWTLISVDGRPPNAEELKKQAKDGPKRRTAYYGRIANYFGNAASAATDARGRTVLRFESLPNETVIVTNVDISANARCEATVDTSGPVPFVEQARFTLTKPMRIKVVAKLERFEATTRYRMMPNGKPVPIEHISNADGSLLGTQGRVRSVLTYTDHRPVSG
ncbi:MAG TPA: hypothetical protein VK993_06160 [Chthoniobacterales bacterium]|nr:hypothetical protein [Chthoniobacterales bacterium]